MKNVVWVPKVHENNVKRPRNTEKSLKLEEGLRLHDGPVFREGVVGVHQKILRCGFSVNEAQGSGSEAVWSGELADHF